MNKGLAHTFENLSKSERRYVRLSFDPVKHQNLFDAYKQMEVDGFLSTDFTAVVQTRLLDHLLNHLYKFHKNRDPRNEIKTEINKSSILALKGDHKLSNKHLMRAKKMAMKRQYWSLLLDIIAREILSFKRQGVRMSESRIHLADLHKQELETLDIIKHLSEVRYKTIDYLLISRNKIGGLSKDITLEFEEIITQFEEIPVELSCTESQIYLSNLKGMFHFNKVDFKNSLMHFRITSEIIESTYMGKELFAKEYFFALNNQLINIVLTQQIEDYEVLLSKIKAYFGKMPEFKSELFSTTLMYEIGLYTEMGDFDKVVELEEHIVEGIKQVKVNTINRHIFYFNLAYAMLAFGNYAKALRYIIDLIADTPSKRIKSNSNIYFYANLLSLIIRLEKEEYDFLPYSIKSTVKQMKSIRDLNSFDKLIIKYIKDTANKPEMSIKLAQRIEKNKLIIDGKETVYAQQFFDFKSWILSRIQGKTMHLIIKEGRTID